jgi:hypothetical protein
VAELEDAKKLLTDPANVTRLAATGAQQERFGVNAKRVLRGLRDAGAGKAEARTLALQAIAELGGGVEAHAGRAGQRGQSGAGEVEDWWVPADSIRFE